MLQVFDKRYKAVSNLFINTYEGFEYIFPSPLSIEATIDNEIEKTKSEIIFIFSNFYDSPLVLDYYFNCFMYLLKYDYKIDTLYIRDLIHKQDNSETNGHKVIYGFLTENLTLNLGETEIYDKFKKLEKTPI